MKTNRLRKLMYRLGLLTPFWEADRFRYLKRLTQVRKDDWRYASLDDAEQFGNGDVVATITDLERPVFFYCNRRSLLEAEIIKTGAFQRRILTLGNRLITPGSTVLDVGSNIGAYALPWATCNPGIAVHCFEPHPLVRHRLEQNVALNRLEHAIKIHAAAVSNREGEMTLHTVRGSTGNLGLSTLNAGVLHGDQIEKIQVPLLMLDKLFPVDDQISLIKIDVQGHELEVLQGGVSLLSRARPLLLLEHEDALCASEAESTERKSALNKLLSELSYEVLYISRWGGDLLAPVDWNRRLNGDLLAIPIKRH